MIEEGLTYCSECYTTLQEKKGKKWYKFKNKKQKSEESG